MAGKRPKQAHDFVTLAETILEALDTSGIGMSITAHRNGKLERLYFNAAGARILGYPVEELAEIPPMMAVAEEHRDEVVALYRRWAEGNPIPELIETELEARDGQRIPVEVGLAWADYEGAPATVAFLRDISKQRRAQEDRERMEAELLQADRMAAVGTLAAGVAHEINNPMAYLLLNLQRAERHLRERGWWDEDLDEMIGAAREGGERVTTIVKDLLAFARTDPQETSMVLVDESIRVTLSVAERAFGGEVRIEQDIDADVPAVLASPARIGQVILNLLVNAAQSFEDRSEQPRVVRVSLCEDDDGDVRLEVADNGAGIPPENMSRIFDPFFTTKSPGEGTGLGLAITRSIVSSLGGSIRIISNPGEGTTATVILPTATPSRRRPDPRGGAAVSKRSGDS